jgi:hypothetical protein
MSQNELENGFIQYCFDDVKALKLGHITIISEFSSMSQNELENRLIQYCFDDVKALQLGHKRLLLFAYRLVSRLAANQSRQKMLEIDGILCDIVCCAIAVISCCVELCRNVTENWLAVIWQL